MPTPRRALEQALAMRRRLQGAADPELGVALAELGRVYQDQGSARGPRPCIARRSRSGARCSATRHRETAVSESDLASVLRLRGDLDGAEALLRHALAVNIATRGPSHPNTAITRHDLALIAEPAATFAAAEAQLGRRWSCSASRSGRCIPRRRTLNSLARVQAALGRPAEALASLQTALDIVRPSSAPITSWSPSTR